MSPGEKRSATLLWDNYRMRAEDYDRMHEGQRGCCAICGDAHENLHVDHCHETGFVRGLLCRRCNLGLGGFRDSKRSLARAIAYLDDWKKDYRDYCANCRDHGRRADSIQDPVRIEITERRAKEKPSVMAYYMCHLCGHTWRCGWMQQFTPCIIRDGVA